MLISGTISYISSLHNWNNTALTVYLIFFKYFIYNSHSEYISTKYHMSARVVKIKCKKLWQTHWNTSSIIAYILVIVSSRNIFHQFFYGFMHFMIYTASLKLYEFYKECPNLYSKKSRFL